MAVVGISLIDNNTVTIDPAHPVAPGDTVSLSLVSNGTLDVTGVNVEISGFVGANVASTTNIVLDNANLTVDSGLANIGAGSTFNYDIGSHSTLTLNAALLDVSALQGTTISFAGSGGTGHLVFTPPAISLGVLDATPNIVNVNVNDKVTVVGATNVVRDGNTIQFTGPGFLGIGTAVYASYTIPAGATYTEVGDTITFTAPCFLKGTRISTPQGDVDVEVLKVGDNVRCLDQGVAAIKWIGRKTLDPKAMDKPRDELPIRIRTGALGTDMPNRDLFVSPDHCMLIAVALVPAKLLINGTTITQEITLRPIEYFHIELEEHDVVWAEGALAETYLDLGNRAAFLEPGVLVFTGPNARQKTPCYPFAYSGAAVDAARDIVAERAIALGHDEIARAS